MNSSRVSLPIRAGAHADSDLVKVLIVDDHPLLRQGLRSLIERRAQYVVCAETDNAPEAMSLAVQHEPQLAIVDITLSSTNGIELTKNLAARCPATRVLVVSMHDEGVYAERALRAGARGFLGKDAAIERLVGALDTIHAGQVYVSPRQKENSLLLAGNNWAEKNAARSSGLSDREIEVLALLGDGLTTRQVARQLNLSIKTIDTYRDHLKRKLGLRDGTGLIHYAIQWSKSHDSTWPLIEASRGRRNEGQ